MMYRYGYSGLMQGGGGVFMVLTWLVVLIDLILVGIWLWDKISKNH